MCCIPPVTKGEGTRIWPLFFMSMNIVVCVGVSVSVWVCVCDAVVFLVFDVYQEEEVGSL